MCVYVCVQLKPLRFLGKGGFGTVDLIQFNGLPVSAVLSLCHAKRRHKSQKTMHVGSTSRCVRVCVCVCVCVCACDHRLLARPCTSSSRVTSTGSA